MIPKFKKRMSALAARSADTAYVAPKRELPNLGTTNPSIVNGTLAHFGLGDARTSLTDEKGVIPLPDEDELEKVRRRRAARRGGGRASTVLSDENRLGG